MLCLSPQRLLPFISALLLVSAQSTHGNGYIGYSLTRDGDPNSVVYETEDTPSNASPATLPPDVYLNASVHVTEIDIEVQNLTAKVNLAAQVLQLLQFNAGVDASIDRVKLLIQNVTAKVLLEARLENLVLMIDDVLSSLDLNPVLATLGQDIGSIANATVGGLTGSGSGSSDGSIASRGLDYDLVNNILYSVNDYSGNTHTNRILSQNGSIIEQKLHNNGMVYQQEIVGSYLRNMTFNGYNTSVTVDNREEHELEYVYHPFAGLSVVSAIYTDTSGKVVRTQVLSESNAGGMSTIGGELKQ
jgi:hypothetical protein